MHLTLRNLTKSFGARTVLDSISVDFGELRALALIGPSGGGKSTLLRIIAGLEQPDEGEAGINGSHIDFSDASVLREYRRHIGVVFQAYNLFPHLTALENLLLPLEKVHGLAAAEARELALATLDRFRLVDRAGHRLAELSGGQKQRVAIARAIAIKPRLLLFDEPTSALDPEMTAEVLDMIKDLKAEGRDFILVTHEMGFARHVADRVAFLAEGRVLEHGTPEELFSRPTSPECAAFLKRVLKY